MQPEQSENKRSAKLMSLDCASLGRMVRSLTLHAVADHFASVGDASQPVSKSSGLSAVIDCNGTQAYRSSR
jgi:hypothetical protein